MPPVRPILISLAVGVLAGGLAVAGVAKLRAMEAQARFDASQEDHSGRHNYRERLALFPLLDSRPTVVMLGDSITQRGEWSELLGPQVANRGIAGDTSDYLLRRLEASVPSSARTVVVMIGVNDLKRREWTPAWTAGNVRQLLASLRGRRLILQSVLYGSDDETNRRIDALNAALKLLCAEGDCEWLDLNPVIAPSGRLVPPDTVDGRHLSGPAYARWSTALKPLLFRTGPPAPPGS